MSERTALLPWLAEPLARGLDHPVHVGHPEPLGLQDLPSDVRHAPHGHAKGLLAL